MVEVTVRTAGRRLLLTPESLNERILGVLGRALSLYPVSLHAFSVLSNHMHLLMTVADAGRLSDFLRHFNGNVAKEVQRATGWEGPVWGRRSSVVPVVDDAAAEDRLRYILAHGAKEHLVQSPLEWPGLSCAHALAGYAQLRGTWISRAKQAAQARRRSPAAPSAYTECYDIVLAPLPHWIGLPEEARHHRVRDIIASIEAQTAGAKVLGVEAVLAQVPTAQPSIEIRTSCPIVHARLPQSRAAFLCARDEFLSSYRVASQRTKHGQAAQFPLGSFPPRPALERGDATPLNAEGTSPPRRSPDVPPPCPITSARAEL